MLAIFYIPFLKKKKKKNSTANELHSKHNRAYCQNCAQAQISPKSPSTLPEKPVIIGSLLKDN